MPPWISTSPAATFGQNVMQSYESKDYDTLEIEGTTCKMHPNTLDVTICHNMSQHVMICHDMSRCHQRSTGLFSDEWAVLQKEVNGVEDVPCKRTDDARGSWVLQQILVPGISWILYYFHPKNISGHYRKI